MTPGSDGGSGGSFWAVKATLVCRKLMSVVAGAWPPPRAGNT